MMENTDTDRKRTRQKKDQAVVAQHKAPGGSSSVGTRAMLGACPVPILGGGGDRRARC